MIKPGNFSVNVAADSRRFEFDAHNETILHVKPPVRCVFLGDSITQNFAVNAYFYGTKGAMLNRGIGGDIPYYMLKRFEKKKEYLLVNNSNRKNNHRIATKQTRSSAGLHSKC